MTFRFRDISLICSMQSLLYFISSGLFVLLVIGLLFSIFRSLYQVLLRSAINVTRLKSTCIIVLVAIIAWLVLLTVITQTGFLQNFMAMPPHLLIVILPALITVFILSFSKKILLLLKHISLKSLIYIQTFRILMEFILWLLYKDNIIPVQMTFEGYNYDILVGISAFIVAHYYGIGIDLFNRKWFLISWNLAGIALLMNIVIIAILSTPSPLRQFMNEPANTVIAYFPFVWLPGFVVPFALMMHLFALRKLFANNFEIMVLEHEH